MILPLLENCVWFGSFHLDKGRAELQEVQKRQMKLFIGLEGASLEERIMKTRAISLARCEHHITVWKRGNGVFIIGLYLFVLALLAHTSCKDAI